MLAGAGIERQHEHEPSWAPGPVGRGGRCDRQLHADADRRVYADRSAVSHPTRKLTSRPSSDACLIASTRWCSSTAVAKVGWRLLPSPIACGKSVYIWPTLMASPDGVAGAAKVNRPGIGIGVSASLPFAPWRETLLNCGESSPLATTVPSRP